VRLKDETVKSRQKPEAAGHTPKAGTPLAGLGDRSLLALQRLAGNSAVSQLISEQTAHSLQRCGEPGCECATDAAAAPVQRAATDFQVRGKSPRAAADPMSIFFDLGSHTLDAAEAAKAPGIATPPARNLTLKGLVSEEGPAAVNLAVANQRIAAVDAALVAAGHAGTRTHTPDTTSGAGNLDFRSVRRVEVIPAGGSSAVPDCSSGADVSCGPVPNAFTTGRTKAQAMVAAAITALAAPDAATTALLTQLFGGVANGPGVKAGLAKIDTQLGNMIPDIPIGDTTAPGHRCINSCEGNVLAYNEDVGPAARMTVGPTFLTEPDVEDRASTLIHEGSHGAAGLETKDKSYRWQRLIRFLPVADALINADSYACRSAPSSPKVTWG
jgi:hypothetical protein